MKYEKRTPKDFEQRLKDGEYESATGARRAVGKMSSWKQADKDKSYALIDKHFGSSATVSVKKTTKKVAKKAAKKVAKKAATKRAAAAPAEEPKAEKPKREPKLARRRKSAKRTAAAAEPHTGGDESKSEAATSKSEEHALVRINIIGQRIGTAVQALEAMAKAKEHGINIEAGVQHAQNVLTQSIAELDNTAALTGTNGTNGAAGRFGQTVAALGSSPVAAPAPLPESDPPPTS
jgi:hypothetical protein